MCGIAGYYAFGKDRPTMEELDNMLVWCMDRGKDATGVAWIGNNNIHVIKKPVNAIEFIKDENWRAINIPKFMIMHTRAATQGDKSDNANNHPIFNKDGMGLVHNGIISNEEDVYKKLGVVPDGEVDSETILKIIERNWIDSVEDLKEVRGTFACAMIWSKKPDDLLLFRHNNPMVYAIDTKRDIFYFASTDKILEGATSQFYRGFRINGIDTYNIPEHKAILVSSSGLKCIKEFEGYTYAYAGYSLYGSFSKDNEKENLRSHVYTPTTENNGNKNKQLRLIELSDKRAKSKQAYYGPCKVCDEYKILVERSHVGGVCSVCDNKMITDLECPWCTEAITYENVEDGKCPKCENTLKWENVC